MGSALLKGKLIPAVVDERDLLDILEEELEDHRVELDGASTCGAGVQRMSSLSHDLFIVDIAGVLGFELFEFAAAKSNPVVVVTARALSPKNLKKSIELGARACLSEDRRGRTTPFLEPVPDLSYRFTWRDAIARRGGFGGGRCGPEWNGSENAFRDTFDSELELGG
ncbi:MAG: response regulator [Desulfomonilaceae bacterium]|nr:response regulator [Desulfomonilaceae bacterium]